MLSTAFRVHKLTVDGLEVRPCPLISPEPPPRPSEPLFALVKVVFDIHKAFEIGTAF